MNNILKSSKFWFGVGGLAIGLFVTSKCARKLAVKGVVAGMRTRDNIKADWESVKEEAADIYEEAKEEIAANADDEAVEKEPQASPKTTKASSRKKK